MNEGFQGSCNEVQQNSLKPRFERIKYKTVQELHLPGYMWGDTVNHYALRSKQLKISKQKLIAIAVEYQYNVFSIFKELICEFDKLPCSRKNIYWVNSPIVLTCGNSCIMGNTIDLRAYNLFPINYLNIILLWLTLKNKQKWVVLPFSFNHWHNWHAMLVIELRHAYFVQLFFWNLPWNKLCAWSRP